MAEDEAPLNLEFLGFEWVVSDDRLDLSARVVEEPSEELTPDKVIAALRANEIAADIDRKALAEVLEKRSEEWVRIATGTPPTAPIDGRLEYLVDLEKISGAATKDESGRVDYKNVQAFLEVEKGQPIVRRYPSKEGQPGKDVMGNEIAVPKAEQAPLPQGEGLEIREDGLLAVAAMGGALTYKKGKLVVVEVYIVPGDVSYGSGNVDFDGCIEIKGDVLAGFEVKGGADVRVKGIVEAALIEAKGDIEIHGGFQGAERGKLKAGGSIHVNFANEGKLEADGDIVLKTSLMNCHAIAGGSVLLQSPKGVIAGGCVQAGDQIVAGIMGSRMGVTTELQIGPTLAHDEEDPEDEGNKDRHKELAARIERAKAGKIVGNDTVHQGVLIRFPMKFEAVNQALRRATFYLENEEIQIETG